MKYPRIQFSYKFIFALAILALIILIALFIIDTKNIVRAQNQIKIFPASYSIESSNGVFWQNPQNVFNLDLPDNASFFDFNEKNSAFIKGTITETTTTITVGTTTTPSTTTITTTITIASSSETTTTSKTTTTTTIPNETTTTTEPISFLKKFFSFLIYRVDAEEKTQQAFSASLILSNFSLPDNLDLSQIINVQLKFSLGGKGERDDKLIISYFYNNQWQNLPELDLSKEVSNEINGGYFSYSLPILQAPDDYKNLKIKITYDGRLNSQVYLDSTWIEIYFNRENQLAINKYNFKSNEDPSFDFSSLSSKDNKFISFFKSLLQQNQPEFFVIRPDGKEITEGLTIQGTRIQIAKPTKFGFKPGKYQIFIKKDGQVVTQDFTWGVLTINTNKSIYLPNETAYLQMAALNDAGHTLCNANLKLEIISPHNVISIPQIFKSNECGPDNVTDKPDYYAYYKTNEIGTYQMKLINLDNGYEITDSFEVRDSVPFEIERIGPTRIYPLAKYQMKIKIKANQDFNGQIREQVPTDFIISGPTIWDVNLKTGDTIELTYTFDAPDISPYIYLLGPLQIGTFQETRQWQIASDSPKAFKMQTGFYVRNGSSLSIKGLGFKPELVIIKPQTTAGVGTIFKSSVMPQNNVAYLGAATADLTTGDIRLDDDGFTVFGSNANSINAGHAWVAFAGSDCSQTGVFCLGAYYGSGSGTKSITTGFQPDLVIVKAATAVTPAWRSSAMPTNYAQFFTDTNQDTAGSYFTTLDSTGFTVGASLNTANWFYYIAFKNITNKITVGSFTGTGSAQNITSVGFKPNFVFVKNANASTAVGGVWTVTEAYGNTSYYFTDTAVVLNAITDLISSGFSVGTNSTANGSGNTIYYAAFGGAEPHTASGTFQMAHGSYIGNGNYLNITGLGFTPDLVIIEGDTTSAGVFKTKLMPYNYTAYLDAATANFQGGIISLNQDGFTLDNNATVNSSGVTYYWTAFGNAWDHLDHSGAADFMIGVYYGNAVDNRNIERLPFQPNLVVVKPNAATAGVFRTSNQSGDLSGYFAATAEAANIIQALNLDGFQIGTAANVNTSGTYYYYFAFKSGSNFTVGSYTGTGSSQNINIGFQPDYIWVKKTTATRGVLRTSALSGDGAFPFINVAKILNAITNIISNGFTVYTADETNTSGSTYRYVAWKDPVSYNLSAYRFYANTDSTDVGSPLGDLNTPITLTAPNIPFRLRILINIGTSPLSQDLYKFKLQYAQKSGNICGDDETFNDVSSSTPIAFYDNPTPTDGSALTPNANDPTDGTNIINYQTYVEANNFTNYQSAIPSGQDGEWDFSLKDNNAPSNTNYCLRVIKADGSLLTTYSYIPEIITSASAIISVSVSDGVIDYGILPKNSSKSTCDLSDTQILTNNGNVAETFNIMGSNSTNWTLGATPGNEVYVHKFSTSTCPITWGGVALTTSNQTLATNINPNATTTLNLQITTPTATNYFTQQSLTVTLQAVAH